jgi:hypothetical protein
MGLRGPQPDEILDKMVVSLRDLPKEERLTFRAIGSLLGVSKERAWARYDRATKKLSTDDVQEVNRYDMV